MLRRIIFFLVLLMFSLHAGDWSEILKAVNSDRAKEDEFGYDVAISGNWAIIGARGEEEDADGNNNKYSAGSVYIFYNDNGEWSQYQKIVASDRYYYDAFGSSVDIDGQYAIIGAFHEDEDASGANTLSDAGSAYIFYNNGGSWEQQQKLVPPSRLGMDYFGYGVAISGDVAIVGAPLEDEDENELNTLEMAGSAYIFRRSGTSWSLDQKIVATDREGNDQFGSSVEIDGNYAVAGAYKEDGEAGAAYVFYYNGSSWTQQQKLRASNYIPSSGWRFGYNPKLDGNRLIVGVYLSGNNAFIFERDGTTWTETAMLTPSDAAANDYFGCDVDISGNLAIIGAWGEDEDAAGSNTLSKAGSAYIFYYSEGTWIQHQKIVASDRAAEDQFGYCVGIDGNYAIAGAFYNDINGDNRDAGAAYFFVNTAEVPLPMTLTSFTANAVNGVVELTWETASETDNARFLIYRNDVVIAGTAGAGTTTEPHTYSFVDDTVVPGVTYTYTLADVSYANEETRYENNAVTVTLGNDLIEADFTVGAAYPNPFNPRTVVSMHYAVGSNTVVNIYNTQGVLVDQLINGFVEAGSYELTWNASDMPSGVYIVKIQAGEFVNSQKIVLLK